MRATIRSRRLAAGRGAAVDAGARGRPRRLARRGRRRVCAASGGGVHRSPPRRRSYGARPRGGGRATRRSRSTCRSPPPGSTCGPTCPTSRSSRGRTGLGGAHVAAARGEHRSCVRRAVRRSGALGTCWRRSSCGRAASSRAPTGQVCTRAPRGRCSPSPRRCVAKARAASASRIPATAGARARSRPRGSRSCRCPSTATGCGSTRSTASTRSSSARTTTSRSGAALAPSRRRALVEWAVRNEATIVEHDYDGHFRYDRPPAGTLQALAPEHVAYVGTTSALLAPTLRIGWSVLPAPARRARSPISCSRRSVGQPRLPQLALAELIRRGSLDRQLRRARAAYRRRYELLAGAVVDALHRRPADRRAGRPLRRRSPFRTAPTRRRSSAPPAAGAWRSTASASTACEPQPPGLVLGFAAASEPTLQRGLEELAAVLTAAL